MGITRLTVGLLLLVTLSSCSSQSKNVTLASGIPGGYYNRLGQQLDESAQASVGMAVQNLSSQGTQQNLQYLLTGQADFALVQLDVASSAMHEGKVQAIALLANEHVHVITHAGSRLQSTTDLQGKRVAIGSPGSGIRYTAEHLLQAARLQVRTEDASIDQALQQLIDRRLDAMIYVGSMGANETLRQGFLTSPSLQLLPIQPSLVNYLTIMEPGSYQSAEIPIGTYSVRPAIPPQPIPTFSTATVLVTRPGVSRQKVELLTWAVLSTSRRYAQFYPELLTGEARSLLQRGLFYIHPAAQTVYDQGDPRDAWIRYWENNNDLQAGVFILLASSGIGLALRQWRRERSKKLVGTTSKRITELMELLPNHAQEALTGIEELKQEHRLQFISGAVSPEVYGQIQQKTQLFTDQCRSLLDEQHKKLVMDTLLLLDDWQAKLQTNPDEAMKKLAQIKHQYRMMLLNNQVDIEAYIELVELTLMSLMTLAPQIATCAFEESPDATDPLS
ncbi:TAXI family TRAP transporter solute-binding subunit [Pantanalinema rosaneae CENA516]|uniref:TAXI family TRAP transporter solute-binding subunit n=1 Tax=Pantanalinema rosaneae TaxID=1620701 RepID=UPI003D6F68DE